MIFSADDRLEGAPSILETLKDREVKGSFFLTGTCLRMAEHKEMVEQMIEDGHYVGGHSDRHILYIPWGEDIGNTVVSADSLINDFRQNMVELEKYGVDISTLPYYLPPSERYNRETVRLIESEGQITINFTSGLRTAADYTTPDMRNYISSQQLIDQLLEFEEREGLNGAIVLIHPGTEPSRTDKLYLRLGEIIELLQERGYNFERL